MAKISKRAAGLVPARNPVRLSASLMTGHYGGDSPWGNADRGTADRFIASTDHSRCSTIWRGFQSWHMNGLGWSDVAYNFGACPHGDIFEGRGPGIKSGAQNGAPNNKTFAWCFIAGAGDPFPMVTQLAVHHETTSAYGLRTTRDHSTWGNTACAGTFVRAAIRAWMATGTEPNEPIKGKKAMAWIIRSTDPSGAQRNALTDGIYRHEFVSGAAMTEAFNGMKLEVVNLHWPTWVNQFLDARQVMKELGALPKGATKSEVVAATDAAVGQIITALDGLTIDGEISTGQDARALLLALLGDD